MLTEYVLGAGKEIPQRLIFMLTLITCFPVLNFVNRRVLKSNALTKYSEIYYRKLL